VPELPEVETIVRGLAAAAIGKEIRRAEIRLAKIAVAPAGVSFVGALAGERIVAARRRGKYAILDLASAGAS
jgi:formamidopyrimidine-DNA glycosylase